MRRLTWIASLCVLAPIAACNGEVTGGRGQAGDESTIADSARFPRLTNSQWQSTVRDLFYLDDVAAISTELQPDPPLGRFDNNIARLAFSAAHWRGFQRAAEEVAEFITSSPALVAAISPSDEPAELEAAGRAFIEHFAPRAFRRPLQAGELDSYLAIFLEGASHYPGTSESDAGKRLVIEALLQSPHFLYRVEDSESAKPGLVSLDGFEVASRLSYAFWNSMPSDELFAAASDGSLDTQDGVREWAATMFEDPRTEKQFDSFHVQAFQLDEYADLDKSAELFPNWRREIGEAMLRESEMFLSSEVLGGGGIKELLTSTKSFVNADLAALYGLEGDFGSDFVEVELDPTQRSGMLTRLGFLTRNATLTQSDPIHRGVFVNLNLICRPLSAVPNLPDNLMPVGDTNRERVNSLTGPGTCGEGCHATLINPIGFSLEHYDALGQYREEEGGQPVNSADVYTFESGEQLAFDDAIGLSAQLASSVEVHACYIQQLLEYLLGRDLEAQDMELVAQYAQESVDQGLSIREIILRVVESKSFRYRVAQGAN